MFELNHIGFLLLLSLNNRLVTIQHHLKPAKSLLAGVSGGNVGGMDADASLQGCIYGIFRKICPLAATIPYVLNSYID